MWTRWSGRSPKRKPPPQRRKAPNLPTDEDSRWLAAVAALAERGRPLSQPNPAVAALLVAGGIVVGRGWTQAGGRPHAEAMALAQAGEWARGATLYVTLEPCAHQSTRGPACADLVTAAGVARVVVGVTDPDPRTAGRGKARLRGAGIVTQGAGDASCAGSLAGYLARAALGRPHVTLKLATSLDGCIALADGSSRWITGPAARAHTHRERARADAILVGGGTLRADAPALDVRLSGLEDRAPARLVLTRGAVPPSWTALPDLQAIHDLPGVQYMFVEGGAETAAAFLRADLVDRLLLYRAPVLLGGGKPALADLQLAGLWQAHDRWQLTDRRSFAPDTLEIFTRTR